MSWKKQYQLLKEHIDARFDALEEKLLQQQEQSDPEPQPILIQTLGLPSQQEDALIDAGYEFVHQLRDASDDELLAVDGVGKRTVDFIRGRTG